MSRTSRTASANHATRLRSSAASTRSKSAPPRVTRKRTQPKRIAIGNPASKVREARCLARASRERSHATRAQGTRARKVPSITISGAWLRSAGFAPGKPCLVRAFAYRQLVIFQPD
jgi:Toxin SymE, type I toxin-antitoxin system